jgi:hypothetical protein
MIIVNISILTIRVIGGTAWAARLIKSSGLWAMLNPMLTPVNVTTTSHPNRVDSCLSEDRRIIRLPAIRRASIQTGQAQERNGEIPA